MTSRVSIDKTSYGKNTLLAMSAIKVMHGFCHDYSTGAGASDNT